METFVENVWDGLGQENVFSAATGRSAGRLAVPCGAQACIACEVLQVCDRPQTALPVEEGLFKAEGHRGRWFDDRYGVVGSAPDPGRGSGWIRIGTEGVAAAVAGVAVEVMNGIVGA